jgi:hypothetical protein
MQSIAFSGPRWAVIVPAQNEADYIADALIALNESARMADREVAVLVFANGCTDATCDVAERAASFTRALHVETVAETLPAGNAHAGGARRRAVEIALQAFNLRSEDLIFSTDADARVRPDLFIRMGDAFSHGADVVLAQLAYRQDRYHPAPRAALRKASRYAAWRQRVRQLVETVRTGTIPSPPLHDEYGGAGIAARLTTYASLGGFPAVPSEEDKRFVAAADLSGFNVCRQSGAIVEVCTRLKGRAAGGMADTLARLASSTQSEDLTEHHHDTWKRILVHRCHAAAFPMAIRRWEPVDEAIAGLDRYLARYVSIKI